MRADHNLPSRIDKALKHLKSASMIIKIACFVFSIIIVILAVSMFHTSKKIMRDNGWSYERESSVIMIDDDLYSSAYEQWTELDYLGAEHDFLAVINNMDSSAGMLSTHAAAVRQQLGLLYLDIGRFEDAYECLSSAYVTFRDVLGEEDINTIIAKCQISVYDIETGNAERGFAALTDAYEKATYINDKLHISAILASCCTKIGDYETAYKWYNDLGNTYSIVGIEDSKRGELCNDIGRLCIEVGQYDTAFEALEAADKYYRRKDRIKADIFINYAIVCAKAGQYDLAITNVTTAIDMLKDIYPEDNVYTAKAFERASSMYAAMNDSDKQKECLDTAIGICLSTVGVNHELTAIIYSDIGDYYLSTDNETEAIINHAQALEIRKNILGLDNIKTAAVYEQLSYDYYCAADYLLGIENAERAISIYSSLLGRDNPNTAHSFAVAVLSYIKSADDETARRYMDAALAISEKYLGAQYITTAYVYEVAGQYYEYLSDFDAAEKYYKKTILVYAGLCGSDHPKVAGAYLSLGDLYMLMGQINYSSEAYHEAWRILKETMRIDNPGSIMGDRLWTLYDELDLQQSYDAWVSSWMIGE